MSNKEWSIRKIEIVKDIVDPRLIPHHVIRDAGQLCDHRWNPPSGVEKRVKFFDETSALYADCRDFRDACRARFEAGGFEIYDGKCGVERRMVQAVLGRRRQRSVAES